MKELFEAIPGLLAATVYFCVYRALPIAVGAAALAAIALAIEYHFGVGAFAR